MMRNEHGETLIYREGNVIIAELNGAFNMEGIQKYTQSIKEAVKEFQGKNFLMLVNNLKLEGGTPEAFKELEQYNHWLTAQNLTAKAIVLKSYVTIDLIDRLSPSQKQQTYKFFDNTKDAFAWLKSFDS